MAHLKLLKPITFLYYTILLLKSDVPYFSDYKMHPLPNLGGKGGVRLIVPMWLTWLATGFLL